MKIFFRYFLFLALCSCCYIASAGTDDHVGYVVGNNYGVGPSGQKWRETGPNGDVTVKFRYGSVTNNLVFYKPTQLGPTGVSLKWAQLDSASVEVSFTVTGVVAQAAGQCILKIKWLIPVKVMADINSLRHLFQACITR